MKRTNTEIADKIDLDGNWKVCASVCVNIYISLCSFLPKIAVHTGGGDGGCQFSTDIETTFCPEFAFLSLWQIYLFPLHFLTFSPTFVLFAHSGTLPLHRFPPPTFRLPFCYVYVNQIEKEKKLCTCLTKHFIKGPTTTERKKKLYWVFSCWCQMRKVNKKNNYWIFAFIPFQKWIKNIFQLSFTFFFFCYFVYLV